jgi:hypothetical protein
MLFSFRQGEVEHLTLAVRIQLNTRAVRCINEHELGSTKHPTHALDPSNLSRDRISYLSALNSTAKVAHFIGSEEETLPQGASVLTMGALPAHVVTDSISFRQLKGSCFLFCFLASLSKHVG